jgi:uncharacterized membrane protein YoaK (UPF0700 family)
MERGSRQQCERVALGVILTWVAGLVDAVGFLSLSRLLPANMSGNTVEGGLYWLQAHGAEAFRRLWAVAMFTAGAMISVALHQLGKRQKRIAAVPVALLVEVGLLLAWLALEHAQAPALAEVRPPYPFADSAVLTLAALAMGVQNASLTRVGPVHAFTTHVTGTLTKFAETAVGSAFWLQEQLSRTQGPKRLVFARALRQRQVLSALIMTALWLAFFLGALAGGLVYASWRADGLLIPVALLLGMAAWAFRASRAV